MPTGFPIELPRTKAGDIKKRFTWEEKLRILDPASPIESTEARLREFLNLLAFRVGMASITRVQGGPRAWTALRGRIYLDHIVRHLLADRVPTLPPQWIAARSFRSTRFVCIDVDAERTPEQTVAEKYDLSLFDDDERRTLMDQVKPPKAKPPFEARCRYVEDILRWVGIDPEDPMQVLIQQTPSGGRHYYAFLDASYDLDKPHEMLRQAGLHHTPGQFEVFPSTSQGLRLPFGHISGQPHDPTAWIRFIDNYRFRRIKRFSVKEMSEALDKKQTERKAPRQSANSRSAVQFRTIGTTISTNRPFGGVPKRERQEIGRFQQLIQQEPKSPQEAQELMTLGILLPATRTVTLKHLAAHLIWFRGLSAGEATDQLVTWAYDWRHDSKDIRNDLEQGTRHVAKHIATMCSWYAEQKKPRTVSDRPLFAFAEIASLWSHVQETPVEERTNQAHFYLHFLRFAKHHGQQANDSSGWEAAPAINAVVKQWEGCRHGNDYRKRIDHAVMAGIFTMTREKWQNPRGKGRARTYRLAVPVVPREEWTLDYDAAFGILTQETDPLGQTVAQERMTVQDTTSEIEEGSVSHERSRERDAEADRIAGIGDHPAPIPQACSGTHLDQGASERSQQPDAANRIPGETDGEIGTVPAARTRRTIREETGYRSIDLEWSQIAIAGHDQKQYMDGQSAVLALLADPKMPPLLRHVLTADPTRLTYNEAKARTALILHHRSKSARQPCRSPFHTESGHLLPKRERMALETASRRQVSAETDILPNRPRIVTSVPTPLSIS